MFLVLWEFDVKPGFEERFESVYGPSGDWAQLFLRDPAYQRTLLLRDPFRMRTYVTLDFWDSKKAYDSFCQGNTAAYSALDEHCEELTSAERKLGAFEQLPENPWHLQRPSRSTPLDWTQRTARLLHFFTHNGTRPSGFKSG